MMVVGWGQLIMMLIFRCAVLPSRHRFQRAADADCRRGGNGDDGMDSRHHNRRGGSGDDLAGARIAHQGGDSGRHQPRQQQQQRPCNNHDDRGALQRRHRPRRTDSRLVALANGRDTPPSAIAEDTRVQRISPGASYRGASCQSRVPGGTASRRDVIYFDADAQRRSVRGRSLRPEDDDGAADTRELRRANGPFEIQG